jgi:hypothetical protein
LVSTSTQAVNLSIQADVQGQYFPNKSEYKIQESAYASFTFKPELYWEWNDGDDSFTFTPFKRVDATDNERSHFDIREFLWIHVGDSWESRVGITKVYWGFTESQHLVDIVNQTDMVEAIDGEEKLGQPMIGLTFPRDWGLIEAYVLLGFRERTYPGERGRFRIGEHTIDEDFVIEQAIERAPEIDQRNLLIRNSPYVVINADLANNEAFYQSDAEDRHIDFALRWSHSFGDLDAALSYFRGTAREPQLAIANTGELNPSAGAVELALSFHPYYQQMEQAGLALQWLIGDWTWKLESVYRSNDTESYVAATAGFEYTLFGLFGTNADVGLLMEYSYDDRGVFDPAKAVTSVIVDDPETGYMVTTTSSTSAQQDDTFIGGRITLNDIQSTQFLGGIIRDNEYGSESWFLEFSRRINDGLVLSIEGQRFHDVAEEDLISVIKQDDYVQVEAQFYF